ncbi:hypothetical protein GCM10027348_22090 [Hymenobacter tenuis]
MQTYQRPLPGQQKVDERPEMAGEVQHPYTNGRTALLALWQGRCGGPSPARPYWPLALLPSTNLTV